MCSFNNWQGLGRGNSPANNNFIYWGLCTGACTSHSHISGVKLHGAKGFMTPKLHQNIKSVCKSRREPSEIIKEKRNFFIFITVCTASTACGQALWGQTEYPKIPTAAQTHCPPSPVHALSLLQGAAGGHRALSQQPGCGDSPALPRALWGTVGHRVTLGTQSHCGA